MPDYMDPNDEGETSADKPADDMPKEDDGAETSLLPKSFFGQGCKMDVGSECSVKIVAIHGDEIEVECCGEKDKKDENDNSPDDSEDMDGVMGQMDAMAK